MQPPGRVNSVSRFPAKRSCFKSYCRSDGIIYSYKYSYTPVTFPCTLLCFKSYCITSTLDPTTSLHCCCVVTLPTFALVYQAGTDDEPIPDRGRSTSSFSDVGSKKSDLPYPELRRCNRHHLEHWLYTLHYILADIYCLLANADTSMSTYACGIPGIRLVGILRSFRHSAAEPVFRRFHVSYEAYFAAYFGSQRRERTRAYSYIERARRDHQGAARNGGGVAAALRMTSQLGGSNSLRGGKKKYGPNTKARDFYC